MIYIKIYLTSIIKKLYIIMLIIIIYNYVFIRGG